MDVDRREVTVIGGGPAGLAAALAAAGAGAQVLIVEREERPGGILKQCIHDGFGLLRYGERLTGPEYALRDTEQLCGLNVEVLTRTFVHELRPGGDGWDLTLVDAGGIREVKTASLVMATGCRERSDRQVFLQGDRPAGIFTAGQAQRLININGLMPGRKVVILGSGDIGLIMARRLTLEGARVLGVWEIAEEPSGLPRNVAQCLEDFSIPLYTAHTVTEVHGHERVEAVTVCPVNRSGRALEEHAERIECDTLVLSVGLIPENDLIRDVPGVPEDFFDPKTGGPRVNQYRETGLPGLYVCGNALQVYDLVDYVSECGASAGLRAAAHAREAAHARAAAGAASNKMWAAVHEKGAAGKEAPARTVAAGRVRLQGLGTRLLADAGLASVVPQYLSLGDAAENGAGPKIFFRAAKTLESAKVEFSADGAAVEERRLSPIRPQEMECFTLRSRNWQTLCSAAPKRLSLRAEAVRETVREADDGAE